MVVACTESRVPKIVVVSAVPGIGRKQERAPQSLWGLLTSSLEARQAPRCKWNVIKHKLNPEVRFPHKKLDLTGALRRAGSFAPRHRHDKVTFDLFGVTNHHGGIGSGHYTAFARNARDKRWHYFDDSTVKHAIGEDGNGGGASSTGGRGGASRAAGKDYTGRMRKHRSMNPHVCSSRVQSSAAYMLFYQKTVSTRGPLLAKAKTA